MAENSQELVLASTSKYRRNLLRRLGIAFHEASPEVDETSFQREIPDPNLLARTLARAKAAAVLRHRPTAVVIGSDQLVDLDGTVLGKPGTTDAAVEQLLRMAGRAHRLLTAVCVISSESEDTFINETRLWMRPLDRAEAIRYVLLDKPLDCAGSYKIEEAGIALFDRIECDDFTAITGLPLIRLAGELRRRGFTVP